MQKESIRRQWMKSGFSMSSDTQSILPPTTQSGIPMAFAKDEFSSSASMPAHFFASGIGV